MDGNAECAMSDFEIVCITFGGVSAAFAGMIVLIVNWERVTVWFIRTFRIDVYPEAVSLALLIYQHPDEWKGDAYAIEHPKVGRVRYAISNRISIPTDIGDVMMNPIESRIVFNAIKWLQSYHLKKKLAHNA